MKTEVSFFEISKSPPFGNFGNLWGTLMEKLNDKLKLLKLEASDIITINEDLEVIRVYYIKEII